MAYYRKRINGMNFDYQAMKRTKREAQAKAQRIRAEGNYVRIIKDNTSRRGPVYHIYARRK